MRASGDAARRKFVYLVLSKRRVSQWNYYFFKQNSLKGQPEEEILKTSCVLKDGARIITFIFATTFALHPFTNKN